MSSFTRWFNLAALVAGLGSAPAFGVIIGGTNYVGSGPTENVTATFLAPDGGVTAGTYSGLVEVTVSGTGFSLFSRPNDAFYIFDVITHDSLYYQLTFGTAPLQPVTPSQDAKNWIVYDYDAGLEVSPPHVPAYRADHTYHLAFDTGSVALTTLHFGVSDGNFGDNGGAFQISVRQLVADTGTGVPDATSVGGMMLAGLATLAALRRPRTSRLG